MNDKQKFTSEELDKILAGTLKDWRPVVQINDEDTQPYKPVLDEPSSEIPKIPNRTLWILVFLALLFRKVIRR